MKGHCSANICEGDKLFSSRAVVESRARPWKRKWDKTQCETENKVLVIQRQPASPATYEMAYVLIELVFPNSVSHIPREIEEDVLRQPRHDQSTHHPPFFDWGITQSISAKL